MPAKKPYTVIRYTAESGRNYAKKNACLVEGAVTPGQIKAILDCLDEGKYFVPEQVGFPCVRVNSWAGDRKIFCVLTEESFSPWQPQKGEDKDIFTLSAIDLVGRFKAAKGKWSKDPEKYGIVPYGGPARVLGDGKKHGYPYAVYYNGICPCVYIGIPDIHPLYDKDEMTLSRLPCHGDVNRIVKTDLPQDVTVGWQSDKWLHWDYSHGNDLVMCGEKAVCPGRVWTIPEIMAEVETVTAMLRAMQQRAGLPYKI